MHIRWRGLELPSVVNCDAATLTGTYGKFIAEPFERGFGVTIGNSLRRVLLSSLEGSAVTQIKIRGAQHEFTTIPGVLEDVTDIVLNVKSLVVKNHSDSTRVITVEKNTTGVITGADVQTDSDVEIINKNHVLATLTDNVPFMMEMVVENGRGYVPSTEHSAGDHEIGIIPIDAVYSPVTRVRYEVEETRVGQKTNYDKLTLEIWTNGSVHPGDGAGRSGQDPPQAPQPVRAVCRAWARGFTRRLAAASIGVDGALEAKLEHEPGRTEALGPGDELPGIREHQHGPRPGAEDRRSAAGSPQLRRDHAERSQGKAARAGPVPGHASAAGCAGPLTDSKFNVARVQPCDIVDEAECSAGPPAIARPCSRTWPARCS